VSSAGYFPRAGRVAPEDAQLAAAQWNVDLREHRSRVVTADMVRDAGVVFVFDEDNYSRLVNEFAFAKPSIHYLGAMIQTSPLIIKDPYGGDLETFRAVYSQIAEAVAAAGSLLTSSPRISPLNGHVGLREGANIDQ
jgi:protein-tyrosine-phosphatase